MFLCAYKDTQVASRYLLSVRAHFAMIQLIQIPIAIEHRVHTCRHVTKYVPTLPTSIRLSVLVLMRAVF